MKINKSKIKNCQAGYTIMETMISVSVFIIIVMAGMGALLNANLLHKKSQNMRSIVDNLSFVIEDISRNLRTGYNYRCLTGSDNFSNMITPLSCESGWGIAFESAEGSTQNGNDQWVYYISGAGKIFKSTQGPYVPSSFVQLTPDEVVIDQVNGFSVLGAEGIATDTQQPLVNIRLVGRIILSGSTETVTPFSLQTSISERLVDI